MTEKSKAKRFYDDIIEATPPLTIDMVTTMEYLETNDEIAQFIDFILTPDRYVEIIDFPSHLRKFVTMHWPSHEYHYIVKLFDEEFYLEYFRTIESAVSYCKLNGYTIKVKE